MLCRAIIGKNKKRARVPKFNENIINIPYSLGGIYSFGWECRSFNDLPTKLNWCVLTLKNIYSGYVGEYKYSEFEEYALRLERVIKEIYPNVTKIIFDEKAINEIYRIGYDDLSGSNIFKSDENLLNVLKYPDAKIIIS